VFSVVVAPACPGARWTVTTSQPPEFDVGDRVVTVDSVGSLLRRVPRGSAGIVVGRTPQRLVAVRFGAGRVEHVHPSRLRFEQRGVCEARPADCGRATRRHGSP
jgi:hypothetical protein